MTEGKCKSCGNEYKNLEVHKRHCKGKIKEETPKQYEKPPVVLLGTPWYKKLFSRNPKIIKTEAIDPQELLNDLEKWQKAGKRPSKLFNRGKDFIQAVFVSKITGTKAFWAEYDGIGWLRTKNRMYKLPKENLYGDVFIWDVDNKKSITEYMNATKEDAEDSFHILQVANQYYALGRAAREQDANKIGMILIIVILIGLISLVNVYLTYKGFDRIGIQLQSANDAIQAYIKAHP